MKIKVLNVLTTNLCLDGISNSAMNYYRHINRDTIQIDFVCQNVIDSIKTEIESNGDKVYVIGRRKKKPVQYSKKLSKLIKDNQYDIVHVHGSSSILCIEMIVAKKAGCKVRIAHSHNTKSNYRIIDRLLRPIFYSTYTHGFACGGEAGKWLFGEKPFEIINNGKNIEEFEYNEPAREKIRKDCKLEDCTVIGHVGSFNDQKNHKYLIDIFYELLKENDKKYKLLLIGGGKLEQTIKEQVEELGIDKDVIFVGETTEVNKWLQAMDIMVFPSKFEGFPIVLVESQIAGLPCVVSDKITKEVELTGLIQFQSIEDKPEVWANAIRNVKIEDREKNKVKIIQEIRDKGFDIKENAKKLEDIYIRLYKEAYEKLKL